MQIPLAAGHSQVVVQFTRTRDRTLGLLISLAAMLIVLVAGRVVYLGPGGLWVSLSRRKNRKK